MAPPPLLAGALKVMVAWPLPGVDAADCGAPGGVMMANVAVTAALAVRLTRQAPLPEQPPPDQLAR